MNCDLEKLIEELEVTIIKRDHLDGPGHYIACINTILISAALNEFEETKVLFHELGHAAEHQNNYILYQKIKNMHSKMENEAEEFMIEHLLKIYMDELDFPEDSFNIIQFLESNELDLGYEHFVKQLLRNYAPIASGF